MPQIRCVDLLGQYWPQIYSLFWEKRRCRGEDRRSRASSVTTDAEEMDRTVLAAMCLHGFNCREGSYCARADTLMNKSSSSLKRNECVKRNGWHRAASVLWGAAGMVRIACGPCAVGSAKRCTRISVQQQQNRNRIMRRRSRGVTVVMTAQVKQRWLDQRGVVQRVRFWMVC